MDFDMAAQRLARDQSKLRQKKSRQGVFGGAVSAKAKREAELRKQEQERRLAAQRKAQQQRQYWEQYMRQCDRKLHLKSLSSAAAEASTATSSLQLEATSIHGEGDKIALPPSVLELLTNQQQDNGGVMNQGSPWTFRIGILNPEYASFPQSAQIKALQPPVDDSMDCDEEEEDEAKHTAPYLDELSHKYLALTHGTVVEFTQEEGCVGLPAAVAAALVAQNPDKIPVKRTIDPAGPGGASVAELKDVDMVENSNDPPDTQQNYSDMQQNDEDADDGDEKTPGHLAWGEFDVPTLPIELSLVQLPRGRACTLQPTIEAIQNGFYGLQNVKLVLEQSLIRTRAVLSVGDLVHTWHRGVQYDLTVQAVEPADYRAVVCINTDLTVDFVAAPVEPMDEQTNTDVVELDSTEQEQEEQGGYTLSGGRILGSAGGRDKQAETTPNDETTTSTVGSGAGNSELAALLVEEEPPAGALNVCTIQIRSPGGTSVTRRLNVNTSTVRHLFALAATTTTHPPDALVVDFQLVTRFPRTVLTLAQDGNRLLNNVLVGTTKQELFFMERMA